MEKWTISPLILSSVFMCVSGFIDSPFDKTTKTSVATKTTSTSASSVPASSVTTHAQAHPGAITNDVQTLKASVLALVQENTALKSEISGLKTSVASLLSRIQTIEKDNVALQSKMASIRTDVDNLAPLRLDVTGLQRDTSTLQGKVAQLQSSRTPGSSLSSNITVLESKVAVLTSNFETMRQILANETSSRSFITSLPPIDSHSTIIPFVPNIPFSGNNGSIPRGKSEFKGRTGFQEDEVRLVEVMDGRREEGADNVGEKKK